MRQIFTSQRLETVEGVARLLEDAGIETYTSNARSYKGRARTGFSYSQPNHQPQPAVWVVRADQLVQARELLREAGLLETTIPTPSYMPASLAEAFPPVANHPARPARRLRTGLLAIIAILAALNAVRMLGLG
jgi:hypothetical protein